MTDVTCPECGRRFRARTPADGLLVVYGLPEPELLERAERGEILLGGCNPMAPFGVECPRCGADFGWPDHQRDHQTADSGDRATRADGSI